MWYGCTKRDPIVVKLFPFPPPTHMQYIICLVLVVLLEIVAGILGFVYRGVVVRNLREYMCCSPKIPESPLCA